MKIFDNKNLLSYKPNLKQTRGDLPPESINKLDIAVFNVNGFFIKDVNNFGCDND